MTAQEWMDEHGLKVGDMVRIRNERFYGDCAGLLCSIDEIDQSDTNFLMATIFATGHVCNRMKYCLLPGRDCAPIEKGARQEQTGQPIITDETQPKPQEYSAFPTLAEFLS
jgi:hypothetical protein